eukprot:6193197-Pleurochrysis_carterae.AAC.1
MGPRLLARVLVPCERHKGCQRGRERGRLAADEYSFSVTSLIMHGLTLNHNLRNCPADNNSSFGTFAMDAFEYECAFDASSLTNHVEIPRVFLPFTFDAPVFGVLLDVLIDALLGLLVGDLVDVLLCLLLGVLLGVLLDVLVDVLLGVLLGLLFGVLLDVLVDVLLGV